MEGDGASRGSEVGRSVVWGEGTTLSMECDVVAGAKVLWGKLRLTV